MFLESNTFSHRRESSCTGAYSLFERWIGADVASVFVTDEGTSICRSFPGLYSLFGQTNKPDHEINFLASCWFLSCGLFAPLSPSASLALCVCVRACLAAGDGQVDFEEFMTILGPKLLSSDNREGFLGNTIDNIFWQVRGKPVSSRLAEIGITHASPHLSAPPFVIWACTPAIRASVLPGHVLSVLFSDFSFRVPAEQRVSLHDFVYVFAFARRFIIHCEAEVLP